MPFYLASRCPRLPRPLLLLLLPLWLGSCLHLNSPTEAPAYPKLNPEQRALYQQAFPTAARFSAGKIPDSLRSATDQSNDTYFEVHDADNTLLGFLRHFSGPVSLKAQCECSPLNIALAFSPTYDFIELFALAPIEKTGHQPLSKKELGQLHQLLSNPPKELRLPPDSGAVVDGISGATRKAYQGQVIKGAALSTLRLLTLVLDTRRLLRGIPLAREEEALATLFNQGGLSNRERAEEFGGVLSRMTSLKMANKAYRLLVLNYLKSILDDQAPPDDAIEEIILTPSPHHAALLGELLETCIAFADLGVRLSLIERCVTRLSDALPPNVAINEMALLEGTLLYQQKSYPEASHKLELASQHFIAQNNPLLHRRLAHSLLESGRAEESCAHSRRLFLHHPLLKGVRPLLEPCVGHPHHLELLLRSLREEQKRLFTQTLLHYSDPVPILNLQTTEGAPLPLHPGQDDKISVLLFFATWCPHCKKEMPRINRFIRNLPELLSEQVQVIGIRTAVERETQSFSSFLQEVRPEFEILTDATFSLNFARFSRAHQLSPRLPTLVITDKAGRVRFILENGEYKDTPRELRWAIETVLKETP